MFHKLHMHTPDIIKVITAHLVALGVTISEVNEVLKTISLLLAIGYTIYKFITDEKKS